MKCSARAYRPIATIPILVMLVIGLQFISLDSYTQVIDTTSQYDFEEDEEPTYDDEEANAYFLAKTGDQDSIIGREIPDTAMTKYLSDDEFWYAGKSFERKKEIRSSESGSGSNRGNRSDGNRGESSTSSSSSGGGGDPIQAMLWIIIIVGFVLFLVIYIGAFRKKSSFIADQETVEEETEDIFAINYQRDIDKAAQAGNYRLAIRLMFLRLLKNLAEKNIIQYKTDRTNLDYLMQLSSTRYYQDFFRITRNYEFSWYGKFPVNAETYSRIKSDMEKFDPNTRRP